MTLPPPHLHGSLAYRITRVQRLLRRSFFELMRRADLGELSPEQWWILAQIVHMPGCAQSELSDDLFGDRPNVTRMLERMEASGLIQRQGDDEDRRRRRVYPTKSGIELHDRGLRVAEVERQRLGEGLDPADVAATLRVLDALERLHR